MIVKKILIGLVVFILSLFFIVYLSAAVNEKPQPYTSSEYMYNNQVLSYDDAYNQYDRNSFIVISATSLFFIIVGLFIRKVPSVAYGLIMAGAVAILYVFAIKFDQVPRLVRLLVSGIGLAVSLLVASGFYNKLNKNKSSPKTT